MCGCVCVGVRVFLCVLASMLILNCIYSLIVDMFVLYYRIYILYRSHNILQSSANYKTNAINSNSETESSDMAPLAPRSWPYDRHSRGIYIQYTVVYIYIMLSTWVPLLSSRDIIHVSSCSPWNCPSAWKCLRLSLSGAGWGGGCGVVAHWTLRISECVFYEFMIP